MLEVVWPPAARERNEGLPGGQPGGAAMRVGLLGPPGSTSQHAHLVYSAARSCVWANPPLHPEKAAELLHILLNMMTSQNCFKLNLVLLLFVAEPSVSCMFTQSARIAQFQIDPVCWIAHPQKTVIFI